MAIIIVMGVSGSGKTSLARALASKLDLPFVEGDDLHPPANRQKMAAGIALDDADRQPWLEAIRQRMDEFTRRGQSAVISCSALKLRYRDFLSQPEEGAGLAVVFVYLKGDFELFRDRLRNRAGHYMPVDLLASQFEALEEPADAIVVDARRPLQETVQQVMTELSTRVKGAGPIG